MWSIVGFVLALSIAICARKASGARRGYYDSQTYGMTAKTHRRFGFASLAFAGFFAGAYLLHAETAGVITLALYALIAIFYATSFLRGAADYDE